MCFCCSNFNIHDCCTSYISSNKNLSADEVSVACHLYHWAQRHLANIVFHKFSNNATLILQNNNILVLRLSNPWSVTHERIRRHLRNNNDDNDNNECVVCLLRQPDLKCGLVYCACCGNCTCKVCYDSVVAAANYVHATCPTCRYQFFF